MGQARKRGTFDQRRAEAIAREAHRDGRDAAARVGVPRVPARLLPVGQRSQQPGQQSPAVAVVIAAAVAGMTPAA